LKIGEKNYYFFKKRERERGKEETENGRRRIKIG